MKNRPLCSSCLLLFVLMCIGIFAGEDKVVRELRPSPVETYVEEGDAIAVTGRLYKREIKENYQILYLKDNSIEYQKQSLQESQMLVYDEKKTEVHIGQSIRGYGAVSFFEPAYNPGNFDQKLYYQKQNIHASLWAEQLEITDPSVDKFREGLDRFRVQWREIFVNHMEETEAYALTAMILGEKSGMDAATKELYQANGIGHILAISGLHLSFIGVGVYQFLRKRTGSYAVGGGMGLIFLVLYVCMIGFTVSAVRALVMFVFRVGADMSGRHYDSATALSAAAVLVLLWRPLSVYDGGFWLSFGAVAGVILVLPVFRDLPCQGLWASVGINLMLLPILLYYFYEFPLYSTFLNLWIIPLMSVLLFLGILGSFLCAAAEYLLVGLFGALEVPGAWMLRICEGILWLYEKSCDLALALPGARLVIGQPKLWQISVYYGCLVAGVCMLYVGRGLLVVRKKEKAEMKRRIFRCWQRAIFCLGVGVLLLTYRFGEDGRLRITMIDVGQGDSIFLRSPAGATYLIDGGSSDVKQVGKYRIEPFLKSQGIQKVDYVFLSHGDGDHISGIREMLERQRVGIEIGHLVFPAEEVWDQELWEMAVFAREQGVPVVVMEPGQSILEGKGDDSKSMEIRCVQPDSNYRGEIGNASSVVLAVTYGTFDMLLTGDVEGDGEEMLCHTLKEQYRDVSWELLKVAHHGSKNASSAKFLKLVNPRYALISAGKENRYGHPHEETRKRLEETGATIYSTQETGAIEIEVKDRVELITKIQYTH